MDFDSSSSWSSWFGDEDDDVPFFTKTIPIEQELEWAPIKWERVDVTAEYGPEASGYDVFKDPNSNQIMVVSPDGKVSVGEGNDSSQRNVIWDPNQIKAASPTLGDLLNSTARSFLAGKDGKPNVAGILGLTAFLNSSTGKNLLGGGSSTNRPVGYQGSIPEYTAVREQVQTPFDPNRRPGSGGQRYFSDTTYVKPSDTTALEAAKAAARQQAAGLSALNVSNPANEPITRRAGGGLLNLAKGRYLNGATDGMADEVPANIDGEQPAKLSHGEFVIPADVVSHLGNGNSEAGAERLYSMMDKIRQARTGTTKQGKQINPKKYLPA